jgi:hypothetical protein
MNFPTTIERHEMNVGSMVCRSSDDSPPYSFDNVRIGTGKTILAMITGRDVPAGSLGGYPEPSIAEANAFADELIRRWNAHEALFAAPTESPAEWALDAIHELSRHHGLDWSNQEELVAMARKIELLAHQSFVARFAKETQP